MGLSSSSRFVFPANSGNMSKKEKFETAKFNASINYLLSALNTMDGELYGSQQYMNFTAAPVMNADNTGVDVAGILCRDSTNQYWLANPNTVTCSIKTTGLNGVAVSSSAMTGTVTAAATTNITGTGTKFLTELVVGDILYVSSTNFSRVKSISSDTACVVEKAITASASAYYRGGNLGTQPLTSSGTAGWYLYVISNGQTTGLIWSTRDVSSGHSLVDLPSGYTRYRQLKFHAINQAGQQKLTPCFVDGGWPHNPRVFYYMSRVATYGGVSASTNTGDQTAALDPAIPINASSAILNVEGSCASGTQTFNLGGTALELLYATAGSANIVSIPNTVASGLSTVAWKNNGTTPVTSIFPLGYVINKQF